MQFIVDAVQAGAVPAGKSSDSGLDSPLNIDTCTLLWLLGPWNETATLSAL
jgi:hypothetical protein